MFCCAGSPTSRRGLTVNTRIRCPSCATVLPCIAHACMITSTIHLQSIHDLRRLWLTHLAHRFMHHQAAQQFFEPWAR